MVKQEVWMKGVQAYMQSKVAERMTTTEASHCASKFADEILAQYERRFPHFDTNKTTPKTGDEKNQNSTFTQQDIRNHPPT